MIIPKFVWRGTSLVVCGNPHGGIGGERGTWVSRTDPKLAPRQVRPPILAQVQKQSDKGRLASRVALEQMGIHRPKKKGKEP